MALTRGQAAIFDGITFLLLASFSTGLLFVAVSNYGEQEDAVMRSAHVLNYVQSFTKAVYYVNVNTLSDVCKDPTGGTLAECKGEGAYSDLGGVDGCSSLTGYLGSVSVTDLLKRDLADPENMILDDAYGGIPAKGKLALRCAAKELLRPFVVSGYKYYIEVIDPSQSNIYSNGNPVRTLGAKITNSMDDAILGTGLEDSERERVSGCEEAAEAGYKVLSVATPFRVTPAKDAQGEPQDEKSLILRVCIWPSSEKSTVS
ncbi:MAG: hypothetical protein WC607_03575 [Candidatus Micrarchaeia archaeon]